LPGQTPFQTVGPFLHLGLRAGIAIALPDTGERVTIRGRLLDGAAQGIPDGVLEFWHPALGEIQRVFPGDGGAFEVETIRPAATTSDGRVHAPHLLVRVLARGILTQYVTRLYFDGDPHNAGDPVLARVSDARRHTLMAATTGPDLYAFDIVVQGANETVFFDV
jgi:protocatechuate 3,4-dioxygenase alpha subunit